ncbi:serine/threonine protein kinase/ABC-type branched-subunit amino acid transport system substrate-binding protein [Streptomyces canus]|uniref:bifunctional serine/threonine-protein kinase/ABC transporter substrate-binding protein n=1 Tax=Streptomyces canus TaxID=58343 RepID=UPI00278313FE|nr:bifunctional serine/threonine-protein kinase/ABC transporter substrate-binding protein [Streptomyces canus]MDQ0605052.1 serine/threonine protein kinase/ABC-type branched-subunit amino acid transport system substrate-binding protein [Streptomyces canus]
MEPLRAGDPSRIGRYRLLRRLGAGGMGVVFLARAPGGAIAAVKTVRSPFTDESGFRARFRREIETARQVDSRWVVPLLDADADAETPWLATTYVPGPSLAEAVDLFGPLSPASVRVLGALIAEALEAVHGAGLVHRDVKPGNILLAPDGPRLIDFGIARAPDATALTSSGVIVGSPGFLSPEQARARSGRIGPPTDVFSLGCVLAFAATGVRPFGSGGPAGVLMRTIYEEPDPAALPQDLEPLLRTCMHKEPDKRPSLAGIRTALGGSPGSSAPSDWLPAPVTRLINDGAAAVLTLGEIEPTQLSASPPSSTADVADTASPDAVTLTTVAAGHTIGRRGFLRLGATVGLLAAGGGAWWWRTRMEPGPSTPSGKGRPRPELVVAFHGDLTGASKESGTAQLNGARLAVDRVNARNEYPFRLRLRWYDDGGDTRRADELAVRLTKDAQVLAVLGPTTDACFQASEKTYTQAVMPVVSVSVGVDTLRSASRYNVFHSHAALRVTYELLAVPCVRYLGNHVDARRVFLVDDRAQQDFAWSICDQSEKALQQNGRNPTMAHVGPGKVDYAALAAEVRSARADAVLFTGDASRTAGFASALSAARFTGARMATERALDRRFLTSAGAAATGWVIATGFTDPTAHAATRAFTASYRSRFGTSPGWYAAEAYDAAMFLAEACDKDGAALRERGAIARRMPEITYAGITRTVKYEQGYGYNHDALFEFEAVDGAFRHLGNYRDAAVS